MLYRVLNAIRNGLPKPVIFMYSRLKAKMLGVDREYANMSTAEVFDKIYKDGDWGKDEQGRPTSGSGSHEETIVAPYVSAITEFLGTLDNPVVVDLGCGDFNVGHQLVPSTKHYIACDISSTILERNKEKYQYDNLEFRQVDLAEDDLPSGDVAFVRQVLQHLSNEKIGSFVDKMNMAKPYRYLIVTEHLPAARNFVPNRDKPAGAGIRLAWGSGVDLAEPPFHLQFKQKTILLNVPDHPTKAMGEVVTTVYEL